MRLNFLSGLLAGVLLASVLVVASSYSNGPLAGPGLQYTPQPATTTASTTRSSSTTQTVAPAAIQATVSNLSSSVSAGSAGDNAAAGTFVFWSVAGTGQSPSSITAIINHPGLFPLLLLPVLAALLMGFALYRATKRKE